MRIVLEENHEGEEERRDWDKKKKSEKECLFRLLLG